MLARVLKNQDNNNFAAFNFPEIGNGKSASKNHDAFIIPNLDEIKFAEKKLISADEQFVHVPNVEEIIQQARDEAAQIIHEAETNSAIIHETAREKAVGEVEAKFEAEVAERVSEIRGQLAATIEEISALSNEITNQVEPQLVELALAVAKRIVGREVTIDREIALTLVKVSLAKLHNRAVAEVHLNPEDFNFVETHREKLDFRGSLELVEDKSISVGGCLIHTETGDIDARIESQFDEIAHGLLGN